MTYLPEVLKVDIQRCLQCRCEREATDLVGFEAGQLNKAGGKCIMARR